MTFAQDLLLMRKAHRDSHALLSKAHCCRARGIALPQQWHQPAPSKSLSKPLQPVTHCSSKGADESQARLSQLQVAACLAGVCLVLLRAVSTEGASPAGLDELHRGWVVGEHPDGLEVCHAHRARHAHVQVVLCMHGHRAGILRHTSGQQGACRAYRSLHGA